MPIRVSKLVMPQGLTKDEKTATATFGHYEAEPFEIGYARTIGNSLRRVLLSSIEGIAISAVKIEGAPHEFMSLPGVVEDVTDIILALKKVILRSPSGSKQIQPVHVKRTGPECHFAGKGDVLPGHVVDVADDLDRLAARIVAAFAKRAAQQVRASGKVLHAGAVAH